MLVEWHILCNFASRSPSPTFKKNQTRHFDTKMTKSSLLEDFQLSSSTSEDRSPGERKKSYSPHSNLAPDQDICSCVLH